MIKKIIDTVSEIGSSTLHMPLNIQCSQHTAYQTNKTNTTSYYRTSGTMGNNNYSSVVEVPNSVDSYSTTTNYFYKYITKQFKTLKNIVLSSANIKANFYVYEIPNYSSQNLSKSMMDMFVICYTSTGLKVPQSRVGLIRTLNYCYILIPKNISTLFPYLTSENLASITYMVDFKRPVISGNIPDASKILLNKNTNGKYYLTLTRNNFNIMSALGERNNNEFEIYILSDGVKHYINKYFYNIEVDYTNANDQLVKREFTSTNDVFKEIYSIIYAQTTYLSNSKIDNNVTIVFNNLEGYSVGTSDSVYLEIYSIKSISSTLYGFDSGLLNNTYYDNRLLFKNGYFINKFTDITTSDYDEIIVYPNTNRRFIFNISDFTADSAFDICSYLYLNNIYKYNIDLSKCSIEFYKYTVDGYLLDNSKYSITDNIITITDNGVLILNDLSGPYTNGNYILTHTINSGFSLDSLSFTVTPIFYDYKLNNFTDITDPTLIVSDDYEISSDPIDVILYDKDDEYISEISSDLEPSITTSNGIYYINATGDLVDDGITNVATLNTGYSDLMSGYYTTYENISNVETQLIQAKKNLIEYTKNISLSTPSTTFTGTYAYIYFTGLNISNIDAIGIYDGTTLKKIDVNIKTDSSNRYVHIPSYTVSESNYNIKFYKFIATNGQRKNYLSEITTNLPSTYFID